MDELLQQLQQKAGLNPQQAQAALKTVADFAKSKLPPQYAGYVDQFMSGKLDVNSLGGNLGNLGGMFGQH